MQTLALCEGRSANSRVAVALNPGGEGVQLEQ